jgi:hypothetical protein
MSKKHVVLSLSGGLDSSSLLLKLLMMILCFFLIIQSLLIIEKLPDILDLYKLDLQDDLVMRRLIILFLSVSVCLFSIITYVVVSLRLNLDNDE